METILIIADVMVARVRELGIALPMLRELRLRVGFNVDGRVEMWFGENALWSLPLGWS